MGSCCSIPDDDEDRSYDPQRKSNQQFRGGGQRLGGASVNPASPGPGGDYGTTSNQFPADPVCFCTVLSSI